MGSEHPTSVPPEPKTATPTDTQGTVIVAPAQRPFDLHAYTAPAPIDATVDRALRCSHEVAVVTTDAHGRLLWANPASERLSGYAESELRGRSPGSVLQCESTDRAEVARVSRHVRAGSAVVAELLNRHKSGHEYWVRLQLLPSHAADGTLLGFLGLQTDVTAEVTQRRVAEDARDQLLAAFSHEVRTPLNAMLNLLDLLQRQPSAEQQRQWLQHCKEAAHTMRDLVGSMLGDSRRHHFQQQRPLRPVHVPSVIRQLQAVSAGYPRADSVALRFEYPIDGRPLLTRSDLLLRVLMNLVSNGLKYTPAGSVTVRVERDVTSEHAQGAWLRFSVTDTGIGIAPEDQARILQPFETVAQAQTQGRDSTGLGLGLCAQMLKSLGTTLEVHSTPCLGSCFSFVLQCAVAHSLSPEGAGMSGDALAGLRVMVVDDDPVNLLVAQAQLQRLGAQARTVNDPVKALSELKALGPGTVDVVLMDLQMPGLDGDEATRRILAMPGFERQAVVALSGEVHPQEVERALASGLCDFIEKPFDTAVLVQKLQSYRPAA